MISKDDFDFGRLEPNGEPIFHTRQVLRLKRSMLVVLLLGDEKYDCRVGTRECHIGYLGPL